jgi:hypothetical protein
VYLLRVRVREDERTDLLPVAPAEPAVEIGTETVVESMALVDAVMLEEFADFGAETVAVETVAVDVAVDVNLAVDEAIEVESQVPEEPQVGSMSPEESEAFWKTGRRGLRRKSK